MSTPAPSTPCAWDLFQSVLPPQFINSRDPRAAQAVYTPWVVLWLLVFQRLHGNATLNDAVTEFLTRLAPEALPDKPRAVGGGLSANTGAYSNARQRLDVEVLRWAADSAYGSLVADCPPSWRGRRVFLIDGTTVQLPHAPELLAAFPPASNQYGPCHWPILHLAVAHELASGLAATPEYGPMYGPGARSELSLAVGLLDRLPPGSILLADRNFGIFLFAYEAARRGHGVLLRLTKARFEALRKKATRDEGGDLTLQWRPSRKERQAHPGLPEDAEVKVRLVEVQVSEKLTLWLVTTVAGTAEELAGLYHRRQDVETDIRELKQSLALARVTARTEAMVAKEVLAALLAFNLSIQVRRLAAEKAGVPARQLSFAGTLSLVKGLAQTLREGKSVKELQDDFEKLLRWVGQRKVPKRSKGRSYPREVIGRRSPFPNRKRARTVPQGQK